jgi:hypothetical protein
MYRPVYQHIAILSALLLMAASADAQTTNASLYGSVLDPSGAAVPKAAVTARNVRTGVALSTVSNDAGLYIFASLLPGDYTVSAELAGFRKAVADHVVLEVGSRLSVDLKLEVGTASETVTVESNTSPLEAVNSSVSNVVTLQRIQDLPLQNLDAGALIALQPGVIGDNFNGARSQSQNVTLEYSGGPLQRRMEQRQHHGHQQRRPGLRVSRQHRSCGCGVRPRDGAGPDDLAFGHQ